VSYGYSNGYGPAATTGQGHEHEEIDDLQTELASLREDVDALERFKEETENALREVDLDEMDSDLREAGSSISDLTKQTDTLKAQVAWLTRIVVHAGLAPAAELAFTASDRTLAATVARGREAADRMLSPPDRAMREMLVQESEQVAAANAAAVERAVTATKAMAETRRSDPAHAAASQALTQARREIDRTATRHKQIEQDAAKYARELAADAAVGEETKAVRAKGRAAYGQLTTRLRKRLAAEVERGAVLPEWFAAVFGPTVPEKDPAAWYDVGAEVLAYRLVYNIERQDSVIGLAPKATERTRHALHSELQTRLRTRDFATRWLPKS
jgi:hypothetical protein